MGPDSLVKAEASDRVDGLGFTTQGSLVVQRTGLHIPQIPVHAVFHRVSRALEVRAYQGWHSVTAMGEEVIAYAGFCGRYRDVRVRI